MDAVTEDGFPERPNGGGLGAQRRQRRVEAIDALYRTRARKPTPLNPIAPLIRKERLAMQRQSTALSQITSILAERHPDLFRCIVRASLSGATLRLKMSDSAAAFQMHAVVLGPTGHQLKLNSKGLVAKIRVCQ